MAYRILIVDDEAALQNMLKEILAQAGYETVSALTCAQALEQFRAAAPDAVLLDVNLPDGDGFDFCRAVKGECGIPVIFLTAKPTSSFQSGLPVYQNSVTYRLTPNSHAFFIPFSKSTCPLPNDISRNFPGSVSFK